MGTRRLCSDDWNSAKAPAAISDRVGRAGSPARSCLPGYWKTSTLKFAEEALESVR
ncbi:Uncharacterised protein [Mycobacteroides abscessus subsp. abscessus]|nr:Uncharacterised protein [Mycobacteroides abscessus subsp. abscessus]